MSTGFAARGPAGLPPAIAAPGADVAELAAALHAIGLAPWLQQVADLPDDAEARDRLACRWSFHAAMDGAALIVDGADTPSVAGQGFVDRVFGQIVLSAAQPPGGVQRGLHLLPQRPDGLLAARACWLRALGPERAARLGLGRVAAQFRLDAGGIATAVARAGNQIDSAASSDVAERQLWHAVARAVPPAALAGVRILEPPFGWDDIVLPPASEAALRRIELHVRHAATVFDSWGCAARMGGRGESWRARGVAVLFAGPSGTGKTMAAEVLASSLDLRVMAIDLSQIISKYVGETSKNIAASVAEARRMADALPQALALAFASWPTVAGGDAPGAGLGVERQAAEVAAQVYAAALDRALGKGAVR